MPDDADRSTYEMRELLGEHRALPSDGEALFTIEEVATANTVLRGTRLMIEDRLGEDTALPLSDILRWAQSVILSVALEDDLDDGVLLQGLAETFRERIGYSGSDDEQLELPFGDAIRA